MSLYQMLSPYLFKLDAEKAHSLAESFIKRVVPLPLVQDYIAGKNCVVDKALSIEVAGMRFYNPVGLAAGFDKNATMIKGLSALGFGFLEIGTITQAPQEGNPKPRLFRHTQEQSLQNAMGFNNQGSLIISKRLKEFYPYAIPLGINIGKNKIIAQSDSLKNYENVLLDCLEVGDYFTFNLSSPNTPNLRDLQNVSFVQELFAMARTHTQKPLFLKISPDMDKDEMLKVVEMSVKSGASGIIATNTTIDYTLVQNPKQSGGISGAALKQKSKEILRILSESFFGKIALISVGGIDSPQEAYERIKLGASLVQVYSGLVFQGPSLCKNINEGLLQCIQADGFTHLHEASLVQVYSGLVFQGPSLCKNINEGLLQCIQADGFTHLHEALGQDIKTKSKTRKKSNADKTQDKQDSKIVIKTKPTQTRKKKLDSSKDTESAQKAQSPKKTESKPKKTRAKKADSTNATKSKASRTKTIESNLDSTQNLADKDLPTSQVQPSQAQQDSTHDLPKE